MADIFDEVSEDLRAERAQKLLLRYGWHIVALAVLIVAAAAGWQGWLWYQERQQRAAADTYLTALREAAIVPGRPKASDTAAMADVVAAHNSLRHLADEGPAGYRTLARLREAAIEADTGDLKGAAALWDRVAYDTAVDPLLRDFASLSWARRQVETADPALLEGRLQPLRQPDNPWHALADETQALLDLRVNKLDDARTVLTALVRDTTAPQPVRGRASFLLGRIGQ